MEEEYLEAICPCCNTRIHYVGLKRGEYEDRKKTNQGCLFPLLAIGVLTSAFFGLGILIIIAALSMAFGSIKVSIKCPECGKLFEAKARP